MDTRTPEECYVYRKRDTKLPALQRSAMCNETTYRTYGAETSSWIAAIDMLLRWSKIYILGVVLDLTFVQSNLHREPISYMELMLLID